jgi:hypothetical protein
MFDHPTRSKHLYASGGFHFWFDDVGMNQRIVAPTKKIAATMCPSPVLASLGGQNQLPTPAIAKTIALLFILRAFIPNKAGGTLVDALASGNNTLAQPCPA